MIKQNSTETAKTVVTPAAFVKKISANAETQSYDWHTQRNSVMGYGTMRQTFSNPPTWEND